MMVTAQVATGASQRLLIRQYSHHLSREFSVNQNLRIAGMTLVLALSSAAVFASGSHAGGHGHNESVIGEPGKAANVTRTVTIDMTDNMRFTPAEVAAKQGETIRFLVKNSGQLKHELVLGALGELKEHYAMMMKMPEMEHADENQVTVAPGKTGEVIWQFTKAGKVDFACLQPGHYDAGMKGLMKVAPAAVPAKADDHGSHKH